jgi:hypothetical protein
VNSLNSLFALSPDEAVSNEGTPAGEGMQDSSGPVQLPNPMPQPELEEPEIEVEMPAPSFE